MKFIPAPLTDSVADLKRQLDLFAPHFNRVAIDIVDENFKADTTYQIETLVSQSYDWISDTTNKLMYDFDLMVYDWETSVKQLEELGEHITIKNVFLHSQTLINKQYPIDKIFPFSIGLAIDLEDEIKDLGRKIDLNRVKAIQVMTVHSGAQGQSIVENSLNKIGLLKENNYSHEIYIDGGVNEESLQDILSQKFLPDFICVGSYLSHAGSDLQRRIEYLKAKEV